MKVAPAGGKPGETNKELSLILTERQRDSDVEVLEIDEKAWSVKLINSGTVMLLTLDKDGAKLPATSAPLPIMAPVPGTLPGVTPVPVPGGTVQTNPYTLPARAPRGRLPGTVPPSANAVTGAGAAPVGGIPTPTGLTGSVPQNHPVAQQGMTPEEQAIVIELQRQANALNPTSALLPPTPLTPNDNQPTQGVTVPAVNSFVPGKPTVLVPQ